MSKNKLLPFDIAILGYLVLLTLLIFIFGRPLSGYFDELLINLAVAAIVLFAVFFLGKFQNRVALFFRLLYPGLLFTLFYRQTGGLMHLIFPEFLDRHLVAFETAIFGIEPTLWLDRHLNNVPLTEILSACYAAYYLMIPAFLLVLFFKRQYQLIEKSLLAVCLTFIASYLLFYFYPIEGPRYFHAGQYINNITGPIFRPIVELAQTASVHGGCMPSSHVAVALVINYFIWKFYRPAGIILMIINIGMAMATFYGRYHYVSDVVVGTAIGVTMTWAALKYYGRIDANRFTEKQPFDSQVKSVS